MRQERIRGRLFLPLGNDMGALKKELQTAWTELSSSLNSLINYYVQDDEPVIPNNTVALWEDSDAGPKYYMVGNFAGVQYKIELTTGGSWGPVTEADLNFSDITTANSSISEHGLFPKLSGDEYSYLNGEGNWSAITPLYIQDSAPTVDPGVKYLWIDTSDGDLQFWVEDGT